jgi:putative flippase GtrA
MIGWQFLRFAAIGVVLNASLYGVYLLLTRSLLGSLGAMTVVYAAGVLLGFLLNRRITFRHHGAARVALLRYVVCYVVGYFIDLSLLWLLARRLGMPHEIVQGGITIGLAVLLFVLQKYWVFAPLRQVDPALFPRIRA